jgi:glycosyltransferase involved in cell wall biosynthesis
MPAVTIIVPCYNEELRLNPQAFLEMARAHPEIRFLMVNDGSRDGTEAMLTRLAADGGAQIDTISLAENSGKAEAVRRGVLHALKDAPYAFGYWDADLSTPLDEIPMFRQILDERPNVELVMGSRVKLLGRDIERKATRHYLGRVFATCASTSLGVPVYDTQCGAKLFRNSRGTRWAFRSPFLSRWIFDVELMARLALLGRRQPRYDTEHCVYERPLPVWRDVAGSKIRLLDWFTAAWELVRITFRYRWCAK